MIGGKSTFWQVALGVAYCSAQIFISAQAGGEISSAAATGDTERVAQLLAAGADVNARDKYGRTPILCAAEKGRNEVVELLLARGARRAGANDGRGRTPLGLAAMLGHTQVLKLLTDDYRDNPFDWDVIAPLVWEIVRGDRNRVAQRLADYADPVNAKNKYGLTPLYWAADGGDKEIVAQLLARGANVNPKDCPQPLNTAAGKGHKEVVELLLARGADVNAWSRNFMTPLHNAAEEGRKEVAMVLLAAGADINAYSNDGTPLCVASGEGRREMVLLLLEKGGRLNPVTGSETTPLQRAVLNGQKQIVELLLTKGAEINAMSGGGVTPLSWAAGAGQKEVLELLLAKGADIKAKNIDGRTVLHWAAYSGTKEVVELLLVKGAEVNAADESGGTPLFRAARRGHKEIAELLVACGADVNAKDNRGGTPQQTAKAWEHKELADWFLACREADSSVRLAAVEKMVDQELLARFAQSDTEEKVRLAAINKIADQKLLVGILLKESSTVICADIIDRLDGPASEIQLSRLARDPSPSMRAVAVDRLLDSSVLRDISSKDKDWGVRSAAAKQLEYLGRCERVLNVIEKGGLWFCLWSISEGTGDDTKRTEEIILVVPAGSKTGSRIEIERRAVGISASVGVMRDLENEDRSFVVAGFEGDPSIRKLWFRFVSAAMEQKKVVAMVAVFTDGGAREGQKAPARIQMELTPEAVWRLSVR